MQNILYVAEKANAGKDIARVLGLTGKTKEGFYAGEFTDKRIIVAWASGHYITLKEPEDIDEKYAKWTVEDLPITFDLRFGLKVVPGKEKAFSVLTDYLQAADLIVNCGDAGREGELIQRWIYKMAGVRSKPVKRLWTSSLTDKGIREANNDLHDSSEYDNLCLMFGGFEKYIRAAPLVEIPSRYFKEDTGEHHALLVVRRGIHLGLGDGGDAHLVFEDGLARLASAHGVQAPVGRHAQFEQPYLFFLREYASGDGFAFVLLAAVDVVGKGGGGVMAVFELAVGDEVVVVKLQQLHLILFAAGACRMEAGDVRLAVAQREVFLTCGDGAGRLVPAAVDVYQIDHVAVRSVPA